MGVGAHLARIQALGSNQDLLDTTRTKQDCKVFFNLVRHTWKYVDLHVVSEATLATGILPVLQATLPHAVAEVCVMYTLNTLMTGVSSDMRRYLLETAFVGRMAFLSAMAGRQSGHGWALLGHANQHRSPASLWARATRVPTTSLAEGGRGYLELIGTK